MRRYRGWLITIAAVIGLLVGAGAAQAGYWSSQATCRADYWVKTCFDPWNDKMGVQDLYPDGASAVAVWRTLNRAGGRCINSKGYGRWKICDYDFAERHWYDSGWNCPNVIYWNNWTVNRSETPDHWKWRSGEYDASVQYNVYVGDCHQ